MPGVSPISDEEIETARAALVEHLKAAGFDAALSKVRFGRRTMRAGLVALGGFAFGVAGFFGAFGDQELPGLTALLGGFVAAVGAVWVLVEGMIDVYVARRHVVTEPAEAVKRWFFAARTGRVPSALVALAPTARSRMSLDLSEVAGRDDDHARVRARLQLSRWPRWAGWLSAVSLVLLRPLGVPVALGLFFALRKRTSMDVDKTLLRGSDGLWYLLDADPRR